MSHPHRRPQPDERHFVHQPFGIAQVLERHDTKEGRSFSLEMLLDADGARGSLPANLIPRPQRRRLAVRAFCPVLVKKPRRGRFPILIHADQFVATDDDPGARFTELLEHDDASVRYQICRLLTNLHSYRIEYGPLVTQLIQTLEDDDPLVRWYAALAIGNVVIPSKEPVAAIIRRFEEEPVSIVRVMTGTVLRDWLPKKDLAPAQREQIHSAMPRALADRSAGVRTLAIDCQRDAEGGLTIQRPSFEDLLSGTAPDPLPLAVTDEQVLSLIQNLDGESYLRSELAAYRLAIWGPAASGLLAATLQTTDEERAYRIASTLPLISLAAPEPVPALAHAALTDHRDNVRLVAGHCLATMLSEYDHQLELAAHGVRLMLTGARQPPWWCDPGDELRVTPAEAVDGLDWLINNSAERMVQEMAVLTLGLMDVAPVPAARVLVRLGRERLLDEQVQESLKRLRPELERSVPALQEALVRGVAEDEIDWHLDALMAAGDPGRSALGRLNLRWNLPRAVRRKLDLRIDLLRLERIPPPGHRSLPEGPIEWITSAFLAAFVLFIVLALALSWWMNG